MKEANWRRKENVSKRYYKNTKKEREIETEAVQRVYEIILSSLEVIAIALDEIRRAKKSGRQLIIELFGKYSF